MFEALTRKISGIKKIWFVSLTLLLISFLNYKTFPILIDEYASTFLASGIPTSESGRRDALRYKTISPKEILAENTLRNTYQNTIYDGGNGIFYYGLAHGVLKVAGPYLGVFNSLRLLSLLAFSAVVFYFFFFVKKELGENHAFLGSVLLIFTGYEYGLFVRFYVFCCLFLFLMLWKIVRLDAKNDSKGTFLLLSLLFLVLPHVHFFSIPFIALAFCILLLKYIFERDKKYISKYLGSITGSGILFLLFHKYLNYEGRMQRKRFDGSWERLVQKYPSPQNDWLAPTSFRSVYDENVSLLLNFFGLDFHESFSSLAITHLAILAALPIILLACYHYRKAGKYILLAITVSGSFYLFLNFMRITSKYLVALNFHWYYYIILPFLILWLTEAMISGFRQKRKFIQIISILYIGLVSFNTLAKSIKLYKTDTYYSELKPLFFKVEQQFE